MRFSVAAIGLIVWIGVLTFLVKSGIVLSDDIIALITAVIVSVALAGGDE